MLWNRLAVWLNAASAPRRAAGWILTCEDRDHRLSPCPAGLDTRRLRGRSLRVSVRVRRGASLSSGVGGLALGGLEHAGAVLVRPLVCDDLLGVLLVALVEDRFDLGNRELVIPGPRLRAPQRGDAAQHGRAVVVLALVGVATATGLGRASVSTTLSKLANSGEVTKAARGYQLAGPTAAEAPADVGASSEDGKLGV